MPRMKMRPTLLNGNQEDSPKMHISGANFEDKNTTATTAAQRAGLFLQINTPAHAKRKRNNMVRVEVLHMTKANKKIVLKVLFLALVWILKSLTKLKTKAHMNRTQPR